MGERIRPNPTPPLPFRPSDLNPTPPNPTNQPPRPTPPHRLWVLVPLLLLWESGAHVVHACAVAKTEHQPKRERIPGLPNTLWFQLVVGKLVWVWHGMACRKACQNIASNLVVMDPSSTPPPRNTHTYTATLALYCVLVPLIIFVTADPPPASKS